MGNELITSKVVTKQGSFNHYGIYLLFIFWPFGILLYAIKNYRTVWARNIAWLYTIYFGFTFVIPGSGADAYRYAGRLEMMAESSYSLKDLFSSYLNPDSGVLDIAERFVTFIVARFTTDYRFLFAVFGIFMGYFLSRIIWYLTDKTTGKLNLFSTLVILSYSLVIGIWDIGGIRWNIAAVIFVYGVLRYIIDNQYSGLLIVVSTIFVHWSFVLAVAFLIVFIFIKNRTTLYFVLFIVSFFIAELNFDFIRTLFFNYAPAQIVGSRGSYLSEYSIQALSEGEGLLAWYILWHGKLLQWFIFISGIYLYIWQLKRLEEKSQQLDLLNFSFLFYGIFNILSSIPSVGRFLAAGNLLMLAMLFWMLQKQKIKTKLILEVFGIPILILFIVVRIRIGFDYIGLWSVLGNPLIVYFAENNISMIDIIKGAL